MESHNSHYRISQMSSKLDLSGWFFELIRIFRIKANVFLFNKLNRFFCKIRGVKVARRVTFNGRPNITRAPFSKIAIREGCKFNSARNSVRIPLVQRCTFTTIAKGAEILIGTNTGGTAVIIAAASSIRIGNNVLIGAYTTIIDNDFHDPDPDKRESEEFPTRPVVIENNVFIGMNCLILKGVRIGENSVIGANSVVLRSIPPNSIAMRNPCKVVLKRNWGKPDAT